MHEETEQAPGREHPPTSGMPPEPRFAIHDEGSPISLGSHEAIRAIPAFRQIVNWWQTDGMGVLALVGPTTSNKRRLLRSFVAALPGGPEPYQPLYGLRNPDVVFLSTLDSEHGTDWPKRPAGIGSAVKEAAARMLQGGSALVLLCVDEIPPTDGIVASALEGAGSETAAAYALATIASSVERGQPLCVILTSEASPRKFLFERGLSPDRYDEITVEPNSITAPDASPGATQPESGRLEARLHSDRWTTEDRIGYAGYAEAVGQFLQHRETSPPVVVGIQSPWGTGKTSFMRMVQKGIDPKHPDLAPTAGSVPRPQVAGKRGMSLRELRDMLREGLQAVQPPPFPTEPQTPTVWFNAWKYQETEQVWAGLARALLAQLPDRFPTRAERERFWLWLRLRRLDLDAMRRDLTLHLMGRVAGWITAGLAFGVILLLVLLAAGAAGPLLITAFAPLLAAGVGAGWKWAQSLGTDVAEVFPKYVREPPYEEKLGFLHTVEEDVRRLFALLRTRSESGADVPVRVVVFVDDLDRCSPSRIAEVIEAINLFISAEFPECLFVLGMDAEILAASLEVVHKDVIAQLDARRDELGWQYMDKFVQLPVVLPALDGPRRQAYFDSMFGAEPQTPGANQERAQREEASKQEGQRLLAEVQSGRMDAVQAAQRLGEHAAAATPATAEVVKGLVQEAAKRYSDADQAVKKVIQEVLPWLTDNPRSIKRAVNLYRFHHLAAVARGATAAKIPSDQRMARWIVPLIRWPSFVRWAQTVLCADEKDSDFAYCLESAAKSSTVGGWRTTLKERGLDGHAWTSDPGLWAYLGGAEVGVGETFDLLEASAHGMW